MTSSEKSVNRYACDGVSSTFPIDMDVKDYDPSQIKVFLINKNTLLTESVVYEIVGTAVQTEWPPADFYDLVIEMDIKQTNLTDFINNDPLPPDVLNRTIDQSTLQSAEQNTKIDRTIRAIAGDGPLNELPITEARKNTYLHFNDVTGQPECISLHVTYDPNILYWGDSVDYSVNTVIFYQGDVWTAIHPVLGSAPGAVDGEWELVARRGGRDIEWKDDVQYFIDDITSLDGVIYVAKGTDPPIGTSPDEPTGPWIRWTEKTSQQVSDAISIESKLRDHTVFADTGTNLFYQITLPNGAEENDCITVATFGGGEVLVEGTGLFDQRQSDISIKYLWTGAFWLPLGGGSGSGLGVSVGEITWWPGPEGVPIPSGKLVCDGSFVSIADYHPLFNKIGRVWGGDGITNFRLPNLQGIVPGAVGTQTINGNMKGDPSAGVGDYKEDQIQDHTHSLAMVNPTAPDDKYGVTLDKGEDGIASTGKAGALARMGDYTDVSRAIGRWIIQAAEDFVEIPGDPTYIKDWRTVWEDTPARTVLNEWGTGRFHITIGYTYLGTYYESDGDIDINDMGIQKYEVMAADLQGRDSIISIGYRGETTQEFEVLKKGNDFTQFDIMRIDRWEAMSPAETLNPLRDGWEVAYDDPTNTSPVPVIDILGWGVGEYGIELINDAGNIRYSTTLRIEELGIDTISADLGTATPARVVYDSSSQSIDCEDVTLNIVKIYRFDGLIEVLHTHRDISPWLNTVEFPVMGHRLDEGELIGDGTLSLVSSSGRKPVVGNVEMIPGKTVLDFDGVEYYDPQLKWPGRAIYGVYEGYENIGLRQQPTNSATLSEEGGWLKIEPLTAGIQGSLVSAEFPIDTVSCYTQFYYKKGKNPNDPDPIGQIYILREGSSVGSCSINWNNRTITITNGLDCGSLFVSDEIVLIKMKSTFAPVTNTTASLIRIDQNHDQSAIVVGDSFYIKDFMTVLDLPFQLPYTKGTHNFNLWQYGMDWALSSEWSVQGWFYNTGDLSHAGYINIFHTAVGAIEGRWSLYFSPGNRTLRLYTLLAGGGGQMLVVGNPVLGWNHVKILWESGTRFRTSLNGAAYTETTSNVVTSEECHKIVTLGSFGDDSGYFNSYLADWQAQPGIDESHAHFISGLPFYSPRKTYGKDFLWSADDDGNISGELPGNSIKEYQLADDSVSTRTIQGKSITLEKIANMAVRTAHIADVNVTEPKLADDSVSSRTIQDDSISYLKIAIDAVHGDRIKNVGILESKLADNSVSSRTIQDAAVHTEHLYGGSVTNSKLGLAEDLATSDLNDITQTGRYHQPADLNAIPENHYPSTQAGWLEVIQSDHANMPNYQRYTTYDTGIVHTRSLYNAVWSTWILQYSVNAPPPVPPAEFPIGTVYTQYPGKKSPIELAFPGVWIDITPEFAGNFFRARGGNAGPFDGSVQGDRIRNINGYFSTKVPADGWVPPASGPWSYTEAGGGDNYKSGGDGTEVHTWTFDANAQVPTGPENNPVNQTIQIWERDS